MFLIIENICSMITTSLDNLNVEILSDFLHKRTDWIVQKMKFGTELKPDTLSKNQLKTDKYWTSKWLSDSILALSSWKLGQINKLNYLTRVCSTMKRMANEIIESSTSYLTVKKKYFWQNLLLLSV